MTVRVGVIGAGNMGRNYIRVLQGMKNVKLAAIVDTNITIRDEFTGIMGIKVFKDYQMLPNLVDAVCIVTPPGTHYTIANYFLRLGVHCLIEKPVCLNTEDSCSLINNKPKNTIAMVGHIERFNPAVVALNDYIDKIGDIISIYFRRVGPIALNNCSIILDSAIHDIDLFGMLLHNAQSFHPIFSVISSTNCDMAASFGYHNKDNIIATFEVNWITPYKERKIVVTGLSGVMRADLMEPSLTIIDDRSTSSIKLASKEPLVSELEHFIYCIENEQEPETNLVTGKDALSKALEVDYMGRRIRL